MHDIPAVHEAPRRKRREIQRNQCTISQLSTIKRVRTCLPSSVKTFEKAYSGASRTSGVKAKCLECSNLQKNEVASCTIDGCPLWPYRPYRAKKGVSNEPV
jgi:hypothetical protein